MEFNLSPLQKVRLWKPVMHDSLDQSVYRKITSNTLYAFKGSLVTNGALFIVNLILSRLLPPLDLSLIFIVTSITGIFMIVSEMGIPQAVTVNLSERISKGPSFRNGFDIPSIIFSSYTAYFYFRHNQHTLRIAKK